MTTVISVPLREGDSGVDQTVRAMIGLIDMGKKSGQVRARAAQILHDYHVRAFDFRKEFRAVFDWVKRNVRFTRDPTGKEGIHSADTILEWRIGDCDDFSILICSLLGTIGHRCRLVAISSHPEDPAQFSHIYPEVQLDGQWIPVDVGRKKPAFGKGPRSYFRKRVYDVDTGEVEDLQGYGVPRMTRRPRRRLGAFATPTFRPTRVGRVPQFRLRGLGDGWDWSQLEQQLPSIITAGTQGAANIIRAQTTPYAPYNPYAINPAAYAPSPSLFGGISTGTLVLGGLGLALIVALSGGRR